MANSTGSTPETARGAAPAGGRAGLARVLSGFGTYAVAMSTICILSGGITSFHVGLCGAGGASIGLGWPLGCLFALTVALTMAEVASAFPRAGGPYQWAVALGGDGWGWVVGGFNLAGLVTALAAVNMGLCQFAAGGIDRRPGDDPRGASPWVLATGAVLVTVSQAYLNHRGMRLTGLLTRLGAVLIVAVAFALTACLLAFPWVQGRPPDLARLVTFANYSGPPGDGVWPSSGSPAWLFLLGLLLPAYTLTGFDASAQTAEETIDPQRNVPRAIVRAVLVSGVSGWVLLSALVLAAPDLGESASKGAGSVFWILRGAIGPRPLRACLYAGIDVAQYVCGLATLTAASRLAWALARDDGLPCSRLLRRVGAHRTPSAAIWSVCASAVFFLVFVPYTAVAAVCATFLNLAYVVPTVWGLLRHGRWPRTGPWRLGRWYRPLAVASLAWCAVLTVIGVQPPNAIALPIVGVLTAGLAVLWFVWARHRFRPSLPDDPGPVASAAPPPPGDEVPLRSTPTSPGSTCAGVGLEPRPREPHVALPVVQPDHPPDP